MDAMTTQLREVYSRRLTAELLELKVKGELTDVALQALNDELKNRNIEPSAQAISSSPQQSAKTCLASYTSRVLAQIADQVIVASVLLTINFPAYLYTSKTLSDQIANLSLILWFGYFLFKDGVSGQSIGKRLLSIKVIQRTSGEPCSLPQSFLRNILSSLGVFDWVFAFGSKHQRLGDIAANTSVIRLQ